MGAEFFQEQPLNFEQVKALARAMLTVARVDGVHDNEMRLVRDFYDGCTRAGDPRLEEIASGQFDIQTSRHLFHTPELAMMFTKSLILLAYADGHYARAEDDLIRSYASELGLSKDEVDRLMEATKEFLIGGLAHIQNVDALKEVSRKLQPS